MCANGKMLFIRYSLTGTIEWCMTHRDKYQYRHSTIADVSGAIVTAYTLLADSISKQLRLSNLSYAMQWSERNTNFTISQDHFHLFDVSFS
jgi:hypothetical protein